MNGQTRYAALIVVGRSWKRLFGSLSEKGNSILNFNHGNGNNVNNVNNSRDNMFSKILIANRGEIACRVIKTAKKMGIRTVAIYSEVDRHSLHVKMADEAYCVGPAPSNQSYLNIASIMDAIRKSGAEAVHPGYGFLSENSKFCSELEKAQIEFIGPSPKSIAMMGDKIESKIIAKEAGVNVIPGFEGVVKNAQEAIKLANQITYPIMLKASAGGGGKGMRISWNDKETEENFKIASAESKSSFGDDRLLIEKFIVEPRHVEIQLIGDKHGHMLYLPERECSIQRRNQKVIEEAPCPIIDQGTRRMMGEQAVQLAKRVGYHSAGTVEFLMSPDKSFYFLEMNTRLQVEHPITEFITGLDLVELMIRVAAGQKLNHLSQERVSIPKGWSIESRVYAEDPKTYLPCIGTLEKYREPSSFNNGNPNIRCDSGITEGSEILIYYDPLICKLSTFGKDRKEAIDTMAQALDSYVISGITHNIPLLRQVVGNSRFRDGKKISTKFLLEEFGTEGFSGYSLDENERRILGEIAVQIHFELEGKKYKEGKLPHSIATKSQEQDSKMIVTIDGNENQSLIVYPKRENINLHWNDSLIKATIKKTENNLQEKNGENENDKEICYLIQLKEKPFTGKYSIQYKGTTFTILVQSEREFELSKIKNQTISKSNQNQNTNKKIKSPMPGQIISLSIKVGDIVKEGSELIVIEAMKMQNVIKAPFSAKVISIHTEEGKSVKANQELLELQKI